MFLQMDNWVYFLKIGISCLLKEINLMAVRSESESIAVSNIGR